MTDNNGTGLAADQGEGTFITIQKNGSWGWAVFYAPDWMKIRPRWENGDPVTLRDETIGELGLTENDFTAKSEREWPSIEVSVSSMMETTEGKELMAEWKEQTEKIENEKKESVAKREKTREDVLSLQNQKIQEAKETGKEVFIRNVGGYDGDEAHPGQEVGWIRVSEFATPDGKIITKENATY